MGRLGSGLGTNLPARLGSALVGQGPVPNVGRGVMAALIGEGEGEVTHSFGAADGLTANDYYVAPAGVAIGPPGSGSMTVQAWICPEAAGSSANRVIMGATGPAPNGWRLLATGVNAAINFAIVTNTTISTSSYSYQAGDYGRMLHVVGIFNDTTDTLELWVDGELVGTGASINPPSPSTLQFSIGRRMNDSLNAGGLTKIAGVAYAPFAASEAQIVAAYEAGAEAGDIVAMPIDAHLWSFKQDGGANATLVDRIGAGTMTRVGSPTYGMGLFA